MLATLKTVLKKADRGEYAVGAFNINNLEILKSIIETAVEQKSPVIVSTSEGAIEYAGMDYLLAMMRVAAKSPIPVVMHVDHGKNLSLIKKALRAGYTSAMFDGSLLPYHENVAKTKRVVGWAKKTGASVEAEIGAIKGVEDLVSVSEKQAFFTNPEEAGRFAKATGCDALAISVGTAHGAFKSKGEAKLDIPRLQEINNVVKQPLVLHGASGISPSMIELLDKYCEQIGDCDRLKGAQGIPDKEIRAAIRSGIRKINIDSDLRIAFTQGMREAIMEKHDQIDPRKLLAPSTRLMKEVVKGKMRLFGSKGKA